VRSRTADCPLQRLAKLDYCRRNASLLNTEVDGSAVGAICMLLRCNFTPSMAQCFIFTKTGGGDGGGLMIYDWVRDLTVPKHLGFNSGGRL
jgi:hypothetical protein